MKKNWNFIVVALLMLTITSSGFAFADSDKIGSAAANLDSNYTLEDMLIYAIQDEYLARAEYEAIMEAFSIERPFSNIMKSEETHISLIQPLFETYGYEMPTDSSNEYTHIPTTLTETFNIGVDAEIKNIEMYEKFLSQDLPEDVRDVFERLMRASQNHLKAFERGASRSTTSNGNQRNGINTRFGKR